MSWTSVGGRCSLFIIMPNEPKFPPPPDTFSGLAYNLIDENATVDIEKLGEKWTEEDIRMLEPLSISVRVKMDGYTPDHDDELKKVLKKLHPEYTATQNANALLQFIVANSFIARPTSVHPGNLPSIAPKEYARILIAISKKI